MCLLVIVRVVKGSPTRFECLSSSEEEKGLVLEALCGSIGTRGTFLDRDESMRRECNVQIKQTYHRENRDKSLRAECESHYQSASLLQYVWWSSVIRIWPRGNPFRHCYLWCEEEKVKLVKELEE